jgi:Thiamine pyrophosphate enzyme, C-terminal TPP binding domain
MTAQQAQQTPRLQSAPEPSAGKDQVQTRASVIAWAFTVVFYFLEYAVRSSPSVMIPEITQLDLPIKIVVFDNSALGMVKLEMEVLGLPDYQTDLKNPNFAKVAKAMGMMGVRIENPADLSSGLKKALQHSGPALIDVVTDPNAVSLPSHITAEQVVGFGLTMGKLVLSGHIDEVVDTIEANIRHI